MDTRYMNACTTKLLLTSNFLEYFKIKILSQVVVVNPNDVSHSIVLLISLNIKVLEKCWYTL